MEGCLIHMPAPSTGAGGGKCLSCGTDLEAARRRYCSIGCRQYLRRKLNARTGLLKALHTRYAAFYFVPEAIVLDVLPYRSKQIFSFLYERTLSAPADDFCRMSDMLGNAWWAERRRTNRTYLANEFVLNQARRSPAPKNGIHPLEIRTPTVSGQTLIRLQLGRKDLESKDLPKIIKSAFRLQAKKHHPDVGGDSLSFRRIVQAFEEMISWAENPSFVMRRGFPDKWFYDGGRNRWVQPTPQRCKR